MRRLLTEGKKNSIGILDNPDLRKKKERVGMDRDIEKEGNSRETAAQEAERDCERHARDVSLGGGQGALLSAGTMVETYFAGEEEKKDGDSKLSRFFFFFFFLRIKKRKRRRQKEEMQHG